MHAKLVVIGGKANKGHVSLRVPGVIGRSREADLTVAHPMVSRRHCEIVESGGLLRIRDLGSLNGTFVRKQQIREAELRPNDEFTVGPLTFRVEYEPRAAAPPPGLSPEGVTASAEYGIDAPAPFSMPSSSSPDPAMPDNSAAVEAESGPIGIAPPDGLLPDLASWDVATDSQAGAGTLPGNASDPSETGPLNPSSAVSDEADFDLASGAAGATADPLSSDPDLLPADPGPAGQPEETGSEEERASDEPTDDEDLDAFFQQLD